MSPTPAPPPAGPHPLRRHGGSLHDGFRYFGVYETGVCFAILAVNSISGWLDRTEVRLHELIKSGRQFKEKKTGKGDAE